MQKTIFWLISLGLAPLSTAMDARENSGESQEEPRGRAHQRINFKDPFEEQDADIETYDVYAEHRSEESWERKCELSVKNRELYKFNAVSESKDRNSPSSSSSPPSTPERISLDISPKKSISQPNSPVKKKSLPRRCQSFVKNLTQTK